MKEFDHPDKFVNRHIGPNQDERNEMAKACGASSVDDLIDQTVPKNIRLKEPLALTPPVNEHIFLEDLKNISLKNKVYKSYIGMGYYPSILPTVIQRNILENPGWYTQYTPYQAEIAQGRLEALLNFQTVISDAAWAHRSRAPRARSTDRVRAGVISVRAGPLRHVPGRPVRSARRLARRNAECAASGSST